jgi:hypothetical protein
MVVAENPPFIKSPSINYKNYLKNGKAWRSKTAISISSQNFHKPHKIRLFT